VASRTVPVPLRQVQKRFQSRVSLNFVPLRTAIIGFVAVLILFRWLHLFLALGITSIGREVQVTTEQLQKRERMNSDLLAQIAVAESPRDLAEKARELGYSARSPVFLAGPLPGSDEAGGAGAQALPSDLPEIGPPPVGEREELLKGALRFWLDATPTP
jgi:hypothetical protein